MQEYRIGFWSNEDFPKTNWEVWVESERWPKEDHVEYGYVAKIFAINDIDLWIQVWSHFPDATERFCHMVEK